MDSETLAANLGQFTGTMQYHRCLLGIYYTDGVKYLADNAGNGAYWLIDAIASYQNATMKREEFQVWRLVLTGDRGAVLTADDGNGRELARQVIEFTDFPLPEITLYLEASSLDMVHTHWILCLPNER